MTTPLSTLRIFLAAPLVLAFVAACASPGPDLSALPKMDVDATPPANYIAETVRILDSFRAAGERANAGGYRLAAGDDVTVSVFGRDDLSGSHRIGPDGYISLPVVGDVELGGLHRAAAREAVSAALANAYPDLAVTLSVDTYTAYSVVVLGSVASPGEYSFAAVPTLLRAIGSADGLRADDSGLRPERCAIMRGKETILWVDLNQLLNEGDLSLNVELIPGDVIHVTAEAQRLVYVMGEVGSPGIYPLRPGMTALDAIAAAGGITEDCNDDAIRVLRPSTGSSETFDYEEFSEGDFLQNRALVQGDVVFAPRHTLAEIGWVFRQIQPLTQLGLVYGVATN
ncbi:MAG: polysaccharide biosynthesis/export family protein [Planctomycetota bacterium]